jgi:hypothetical protein
MATEARRRAQAKYNSKPEQIKRRSSRNKARRAMIKAGKARVGDGKDVGHSNGNPLDNRKGNLRMESKASNRSFKRTRGGHKRNPRD